MKTQQLLNELQKSTYIFLKNSDVHGIGVFAICQIPKGTRGLFASGSAEWIKLPIAEVEKLPAHTRSLIETYCLFDDVHYFVPEYGFKMIDPVIYLNHSLKPNLISINDGEDFETLRDIATGEELVLDYGTLVPGMEDYK